MNEHLEELEALQVQRASQGLGPEETRRMGQLLAEFPDADAEWADRVVGELDAETAAPEETPLAPALRAALLVAAPGTAGPASELGPKSGRPRVHFGAWAGWALAAAVAGLWLGQPSSSPEADPTYASVAQRSDAVVAEWAPGEDATGVEVAGSVVWSSVAQAGFMRIRGLAANLPDEYQYQLWIFDAERDARYPVDGGVFDVPEGAVEAEVPIRAKLNVSSPTLFAVTVERPGGVVVSSRERIATVAQVGD